jgi:hypothetical protein
MERMTTTGLHDYLTVTAAIGGADPQTRAGGFGALSMWWAEHDTSQLHHHLALEFVTNWLRIYAREAAACNLVESPVDVQAAVRTLATRPATEHREWIDLSRAYLRRTRLSEAALSKAVLTEVNLVDADLSGADLTGAVLDHAILNHAQFAVARLINADLSDASLIGADLRVAKLGRANLGRAVLTDAKLDGTDFAEANLKGAVLKGTDLSGAYGLTAAQVREAIKDTSTKLPGDLR